MLGLYLHIPFCSAICNYCNFNRGLFDADLKGRYVQAVLEEIKRAGGSSRSGGAAGEAADTIYFGGGTPSLLEPDEIAQIIGACRDRFAITPDAEVTLEANPETVTASRLAAFRDAGRKPRQFRCAVVPRRGAASPVAAAFRRSRAQCGCGSSHRRFRQRQHRLDDVAARAARCRLAAVGRRRRLWSRPIICRYICSRCIQTRRSRTKWLAGSGPRRPTMMPRRCI